MSDSATLLSRRHRRQFWLLVGLSTAVTLLLYGSALTLPFFFDDFVHYPFVEAHTFWQIWTTTDQLAYYRPLNFALWRLTYVLADGHSPLLDHGLNVLLHAGNGVLVGWLAWQLWAYGNGRARTWRSLLSAAFYLVFPFSYQVVPWVGAMSHLLVTHLILWSVLTFWLWQTRQQRRWLLLSLIAMTLALFTHENGILAAPLVTAVWLTTPRQPLRWQSLLTMGLLYSLPVLLWLPIRWQIHQTVGGQFFPNNLEGLLQNSAYFVQGAAFPVTQLGGWLYRLGGNDLLIIAVLAAVAFALAAWVQRRGGSNRRSWLPWLWWILASLPAILLLRVTYVINGPRLLLVASVGVAWLWADVVVRGVGNRDQRLEIGDWRLVPKISNLQSLIAILLCTTILVGSGRFVWARMAEHHILGDNFKEAVTLTAAANAAGETAVFINAPSWLAATHRTFALGHEGVLFWPDYVPASALMQTHTGTPGELVWARVDAIRPQLDIYYGVSGSPPDWAALAQQPARFFVANYGETAVTFQPIGAFAASEQASRPPLAQFAPQSDHAITLHSAIAAATPDGWQLTLTWSAAAPHPTATVFVHLVDDSGQVLAQADGMPLAGSYPFSVWQAGQVVVDQRVVTAVPGATAINIGLYDWTTGERETAVLPDNTPLPDNALRIRIGE